MADERNIAIIPAARPRPIPAARAARLAKATTLPPATGRYARRLWSVRHSRGLERFYGLFADAFLLLQPLWNRLGYARAEKPVRFVEKHVKGFLFDCRMCGQCVLSSTGMSCPMNCPKQLRNGPCGGVRANGHCEVKPDMPCVWVKAWEGSARMVRGDAILTVQEPLDRRLAGTSSWLRVTAQAAARRDAGDAA